MIKILNFRKAILLIHGFAGGNYDYGQLGNDLQFIKNFDVFTFTLPGHEKTIINNVSKNEWIKSAEAQLIKIINKGYKEIYLIGHSMGGVIASYLASKYKNIKKLVLAAPAFEYLAFKDDKLDVIESLKVIPKLFKNYDSEEILSRIFKVPIKTIKEFISLVEEHKNDVKNITCPTLIIRGSNDEIVPLSSVDFVFKNIKSTSVTSVEIDSLTHDIFVSDRYDDVKKLIVYFLKKKAERKKQKLNI